MWTGPQWRTRVEEEIRMRMSKLLAPTLREDPTEAEIASHKLMLRAGLIRKLSSGVYTYLPLGWRIITKIERIVREEMDKAGALEIKLPTLLPAALWKETGRWSIYGKELFRIKDRKDSEFCLGPTHEEVITDLVRQTVKSYKELPLNLYQIQTKFRDEIRPRFGVMRSREFIMKDAYSFDKNEAGLEISYKAMYEAYNRIFDRFGLKYKVVHADPGPIGGGFSQEYMVLSPTGEDEIIHCEKCDYAASMEMAIYKVPKGQTASLEVKVPKMENVKTPSIKTIEELEKFLKIPQDKMIKTLLYKLKDSFIAVLTRGDHQLNEARLKKILGTDELEFADEKDVEKISGAPVGFAGPVGLKGIKIYADKAVTEIIDGVTGANAVDSHIIHVSYGRDYKADEIDNLRQAVEGDMCTKCGSKLVKTRGIEVGHIFKLGTKYSAKMNASYLDESGKTTPYVMGCYGIGITRIAGACIEQNNDQFGIIWPLSIAPYKVAVVPVNMKESAQAEAADKIYNELIESGIDALFDDREFSVGVKLKDMDLIGLPIKVVIGPKSLAEGHVEIKLRRDGTTYVVAVAEAVQKVKELL